MTSTAAVNRLRPVLPELVVFDLAGTTVQDNGEVPAAFTAALAEHGILVRDDQLVNLRGASKREAIRRLVPAGVAHDDQSAAAFLSFQRQLARRYTESARPASGAGDTFAWLRARGVRVALNTGFDRSTTSLLLSALGWDRGVADAIVCGDDVAEGRPSPLLIRRAMELTDIANPAAVANVGDTTLDLEAGHNAGVGWNIGVTSGAHGRDRLARAPHTHLVADVSELPQLWVGAAGARNVVVVDYDPAWPSLFERLRERVWPAVADVAVSVEHVGSTSVPGLAAKPVIDVSIVVPTRVEVPLAVARLAPLGYVHRGDLGVEDREAFGSPPDLASHNLYVCVEGGLGLENQLAVRDHLRANPEAARAYGALKKNLARRFPYDIEGYVDGKTDFVLDVLRAAGLSPERVEAIERANRKPAAQSD